MDSADVKRLRSELERTRGRLDTLEQLVREQADAVKAAELDALRERAEQLAGCKLDGADEAAVLRAAIMAVDKAAKLDGLSLDRLRGRFDALADAGRRDTALSILEIVRNGDDAGARNSMRQAGERRKAEIDRMNRAVRETQDRWRSREADETTELEIQWFDDGTKGRHRNGVH